jgi:hypothetical protein
VGAHDQVGALAGLGGGDVDGLEVLDMAWTLTWTSFSAPSEPRTP